MNSPVPHPDAALLHNLRDLGGTPAADGRVVRPRRLFRGGTPAFLDEIQVTALLEGTGLRTRVDLRSDEEAEHETSPELLRREPARRRHHIHAGSTRFDFDEAHREQWVGTHYLTYLEASGPEIAGVFDLLADPAAYPVLLHCTAGKDRTGVVTALVLGALGTAEDHIVADYARTADAVHELRSLLERLPRYRERIAQVPQEALGALPASMTTFLAGVAERYDGVPAYLRSVGVDDDQLGAVRENLLG